MLEAREFVEAARARGFQWYAGVPCSYLTPFINYVLQAPDLRYVLDGQRRRCGGFWPPASRWPVTVGAAPDAVSP
ncbi:MAG: hypothetical protein WDM77_18070 [Steroidobacteraceae bacterium]